MPAILDDTDLQGVTVIGGADIVHSQVEACLLGQVWHFHHIGVHGELRFLCFLGFLGFLCFLPFIV